VCVGEVVTSCKAGISWGQAQGPCLTRLPPMQSMENLYGQGGEGPTPSPEDCDEGECPQVARAGTRTRGWVVGWG
jgi:hypothetical protein